MEMYTRIERCRVAGSEHLIEVLDLGHQALTGVFPVDGSVEVPSGPLKLVWCPDSRLLQLAHRFEPSQMYGENYGYRSGLNASMVRHLEALVRTALRRVDLVPGDVVLDIGSNDSTLLRAYEGLELRRVGIDPTAAKFARYYPEDVEVVADFFSEAAFRKAVPSGQARIVTSIAMFYDLDAPVEFAREVASILADDGIWVFEQSYMPAMLRMTSYDTVCHEHLEYYSMLSVLPVLEAAGLEMIDVATNAVNGGSFTVTAARRGSRNRVNDAVIEWLVDVEMKMGLDTPRPFRDFEERVFRHRESLRSLILALRREGKTVAGYGASTKGNVLLQFCGLGREEISMIGEINEDKFGSVTPGTRIPIVPEQEVREARPDFMLVLPWHFRNGIVEREREYLESGGHLIFPMPDIEII